MAEYEKIKALIDLAKEHGIAKLRLGDIELHFSESLNISAKTDIIEISQPSATVEEPLPEELEGLPPEKQEEMRRMKRQQQALRELFNDL